jgi:ABC-2 type transport system permease protein
LITTDQQRDLIVPTLPAPTPVGLGALLAATQTLWLKHMFKFVRNREELGGLAIQPILWVLFFGAGMGRMIAATGSSANLPADYLAFMLPGIIALSALGGAVGGGMTMLEERLRGVLKEYLVAPIPRLSILLGNELSTITKSLFQASLILLMGMLVGTRPTANPLPLLGGLLLLGGFALGFSSLALALAARSRSIMGYHGIIALFNLPLLFASNALYPLSVLPGWLRAFVLLNPTTYLVDGLRALFYGMEPTMPLGVSFAVVWGFAVATTLLALKAFNKSLEQVM